MGLPNIGSPLVKIPQIAAILTKYNYNVPKIKLLDASQTIINDHFVFNYLDVMESILAELRASSYVPIAYFYDLHFHEWSNFKFHGEKSEYQRALQYFELRCEQEELDINDIYPMIYYPKFTILRLAIMAARFNLAKVIIKLPSFKMTSDVRNLIIDFPAIGMLKLFDETGIDISPIANEIIERTNSPLVVNTICKSGIPININSIRIRAPEIMTILFNHGYPIPHYQAFNAHAELLEECLRLDPSLAKVLHNGNDPLQHTCLQFADEIEDCKDEEHRKRYGKRDPFKFYVDRIPVLLRAGCRFDNIQPGNIHAYDLAPEIRQVIEDTGLVPRYD
jgi:hypothetical protein